ncbi:hypothetical protein ABPG72_008554 [Tetrahymena utriculariae]
MADKIFHSYGLKYERYEAKDKSLKQIQNKLKNAFESGHEVIIEYKYKNGSHFVNTYSYKMTKQGEMIVNIVDTLGLEDGSQIGTYKKPREVEQSELKQGITTIRIISETNSRQQPASQTTKKVKQYEKVWNWVKKSRELLLVVVAVVAVPVIIVVTQGAALPVVVKLVLTNSQKASLCLYY